MTTKTRQPSLEEFLDAQLCRAPANDNAIDRAFGACPEFAEPSVDITLDSVKAEFPPRQADGTINPKDAAALKRVPMHLLPQVGVIYGAMACRDGAVKYGPYNWRERAISLTQYIGAMQRHLSALLDGEDCASDSKLPHLAHVIATASILLDAENAGALLDDRPKRSGNSGALIAKLNARLAAEGGAK
jgi:dATP/dGTP diphosphohydrolase